MPRWIIARGTVQASVALQVSLALGAHSWGQSNSLRLIYLWIPSESLELIQYSRPPEALIQIIPNLSGFSPKLCIQSSQLLQAVAHWLGSLPLGENGRSVSWPRSQCDAPGESVAASAGTWPAAGPPWKREGKSCGSGLGIFGILASWVILAHMFTSSCGTNLGMNHVSNLKVSDSQALEACVDPPRLMTLRPCISIRNQKSAHHRSPN